MLSLVAFVAACSPAVDAQPPENAGDIRVADAGAPKKGTSDYEYVTERPLAVVALVGARGLPADAVRVAVDRVADALDVCVTEQATAGRLVDGASRVVAVVSRDGTIGGVSVTFSTGDGVAANGVLCFVAPVRSLAFPTTTSDAERKFALEAVWGRDVPHSKPKPVDAR